MHVRGGQCAKWLVLLVAAACSDSGDRGAQGTEGAGSGGSAGAAGSDAGTGTSGAGGAAGNAAGTSGAGGAAGSAAGTGGTSGAGGAAGAAGAAGGGGGSSGSLGAACPGIERPSTLSGLTACTSSQACVEAMHGLSFYQCLLAPISFACGGAAPPPPECRSDDDCAPAGVCNAFGCGQARCVPACTADGCGEASHCAQGRCVPKRCDEAGAAECLDGFVCDTGSTSATGCVAVACDAGYVCPMNSDCMPSAPLTDEHGCLKRACVAAADCDCGACVDWTCAPYEGACMNTSPPP